LIISTPSPFGLGEVGWNRFARAWSLRRVWMLAVVVLMAGVWRVVRSHTWRQRGCKRALCLIYFFKGIYYFAHLFT
jgi:hypothetical protein